MRHSFLGGVVALLMVIVSGLAQPAMASGMAASVRADCAAQAGVDRPCPDVVGVWSNPDNRPSPENGSDGLMDFVPVDDSLAVAVGWTAVGDGDDDWTFVGFDTQDGSVRWETRYGSGGQDIPMDAALTSAGDVLLVVGTSGFYGSELDLPFEGAATVAAFDPSDGTQLWVRDLQLDGPGVAHAVTVSPQGLGTDDGPTAFVTSTFRAPNPDAVPPDGYETDVAVTAVRVADGEVRWQQHHDDPAHAGNARSIERHDLAQDVLVSPSGDTVYVAAESNGPGRDGLDFLALAYDARSGEPRWTSRYGGPLLLNDQLGAAALSGDGTTLVLTGDLQGYSDDFGTNFDFGTVAIDTADGKIRWSRTYGGEAEPVEVDEYSVGTGQNVPFDMLIEGDRVFVAGAASSPDGRHNVDYGVVTYRLEDGSDALPPITHDGGNRLWDVPTALEMSPEGDELYVTGYSQTVPGSLRGFPTRIGWSGPVAIQPHVHARTLAIDPINGQIRWTAEFNSSELGAGPGYPGVDSVYPWVATLSPDGQTLLLGATFQRGHDPGWAPGGGGWNFSDIGMVGYRLDDADF